MTSHVTDPLRHRYHFLGVSRVIVETDSASSLVFAIPDELKALYRYRAGQFLTLELHTDDGPPARRCYSLASSPDCDAEHKVTVKRVAGGRGSNWINDHVLAGDKIAVLPPDGNFVLSARPEPLVLFAGGSGITPVISLIKTALATTTRNILLLYANRDARSIIFRRELEALADRHPERLRIGWWLDDKHGLLSVPQATQLLSQEPPSEIYLCGPRAFMDVIEEALLGIKIDAHLIHVEAFFSLPDVVHEAPSVVVSASQTLEIRVDGVSRTISYQPGRSILDSALAAGIDPPHSCQEGACGTCFARLSGGEVDMNDTGVLSKADRKRSMIVTCQSFLKTPHAKVDYDAL